MFRAAQGIMDVHHGEQGQLSIAVMPCGAEGEEWQESFLDDPAELLETPLSFKVAFTCPTCAQKFRSYLVLAQIFRRSLTQLARKVLLSVFLAK